MSDTQLARSNDVQMSTTHPMELIQRLIEKGASDTQIQSMMDFRRAFRGSPGQESVPRRDGAFQGQTRPASSKTRTSSLTNLQRETSPNTITRASARLRR